MNIIHGDCLEELKKLEDNSVDAVVTDPPYGLSNTKPQQVADVLKAWVTGDDEHVPSVPRKGRKNCLSQIILRTQGDSDREDTLARKDFVNVPITFSSTGFPMFGAVDFNDDSSFREIEVNDVSPEFALDDELVNGFFSEFGKEGQDVEFRLWVLKGCPGCVGVCTCLTESSQGVGAVPVRLGYYALADTESATPVVTLRVTEVSAVLSFDRRRRSFELSPAGSAGEGDGLVLIVSPKGVGAVTGAGGLATVLEPGLVGGVGGAADGACSADLVTHVDLLDRLVNPSLHPVGFMGKSWDSFVPPPAVWEECMRVLKPGGHMAVFAGARTQDLMGLSIRLAGFEIRDTLGWVYSQGFPKSMDVSKAIDRSNGENRNRQLEFTEWMRSTGITATQINEATETNMGGHYLTAASQPAIATADLFDKLRPLLPEVPERIERLVAERTGIEWTDYVKREITQHATRELVQGDAISFDQRSSKERERRDIPATSEAQCWDGWGTALKPAIEPIILARKPLDGTVANNVLEHGVGGLNIDACRVQTDDDTARTCNGVGNSSSFDMAASGERRVNGGSPAGRFPANVLLDEHAAEEMDEQSGNLSPGNRPKVRNSDGDRSVYGEYKGQKCLAGGGLGSGGASRFFPVFKYQAKAPKKERPVIEREDGSKIQHNTVKPLALMEWLVSLIVPPGGVVLDPFAGSGTTLQAALNKGFTPIGIEQDADYIKLIEKRLEATCTTRKN